MRPPADFSALLELSVSDSKPVLLDLARRQAAKRSPAELVAQFSRDSFVAPLQLAVPDSLREGPGDLRVVHRLDGLALAAADSFEALQLSPVAPLGTCSVLAPTSQDRTLSAQRGTEVVSDPTNVFALICAQRLAADPARHVQLCTIHQTLRAQSFPPQSGFSRHFRLFALAEAGPAAAEDGFEIAALTRQLGVFDRLFDLLERDLRLSFPQRRAVLRASAPRSVLAERLVQRLGDALPHVELVREPFASEYYDGVRVQLGAQSRDGAFIPIGDSGVFDWVAKLTSNRRLRFVASGFGLQLAPILFTHAP